jgi:hypothetical protein
MWNYLKSNYDNIIRTLTTTQCKAIRLLGWHILNFKFVLLCSPLSLYLGRREGVSVCAVCERQREGWESREAPSFRREHAPPQRVCRWVELVRSEHRGTGLWAPWSRLLLPEVFHVYMCVYIYIRRSFCLEFIVCFVCEWPLGTTCMAHKMLKVNRSLLWATKIHPTKCVWELGIYVHGY